MAWLDPSALFKTAVDLGVVTVTVLLMLTIGMELDRGQLRHRRWRGSAAVAGFNEPGGATGPRPGSVNPATTLRS